MCQPDRGELRAGRGLRQRAPRACDDLAQHLRRRADRVDHADALAREARDDVGPRRAAMPAASTGPETMLWKGMGRASRPLSAQAWVHLLRIRRAGFPVTQRETTVFSSSLSTIACFW